MASILVVEDERLLGRSIAGCLEDDGHKTNLEGSAEDAVLWLSSHQADLAFVDIRLPHASGLDLLKALRESHPDLIVVMMTANADVRTAVQAMKDGASDFLIKPLDLEAVSIVARKCLQHRRLTQRWKHDQKCKTQEFGLHQVLGESVGIEKAKAMVRRMAQFDLADTDRPPNVLITGETGVGKDLFARAIHYEGSRREGPFVQVNCAGIPDGLVESELFGYVKGAFTDARSNKRGLFEVADTGTLFLDEIGGLPLAMQAKVLTAIETRRIRPLGAPEEISVNIHLVSAMNQDPESMISSGGFREDLYQRLKVMRLHLPPLRERVGDIDMLADRFIATYCQKFGMAVKGMTRRARLALRRYDWPGNVRELSHCIESATLLSGDVIDADVLPGSRVSGQARGDLTAGGATTGGATTGGATTGGAMAGVSHEAIPLDFTQGPISLESVEQRLIRRAMDVAEHNVTRAAELLDVSRDTLRYRLEKYGVEPRRNGGLKRSSPI